MTDASANDIGRHIHIGTGFDRNYLLPFYALLGSLIENHRQDRFILHAITNGLSELEKKKIADLITRSGHYVFFYEVDPSLVKRFVLANQWTSVVYYRLFFSLLLPVQISRLIYLDCDTVVVRSLKQFYCIDLDHFPVGAVYDNFVKTQPHLGIAEEGDYFNSGVLLVDLVRWREQEISEKAFNYLDNYPERILYVDQCALNAVLRNNWKKLEFRYNLMYSILPEDGSKTQIRQLLKDAVVVHFTLHRPWQMLCKNRLRNLYFYYLNRSGMKSSFSYYTDFEFRKLPAMLMIRIKELYFDMPFIQRIWRSLQIK